MPAKKQKIKIGILGASGYTGADLIRIAAQHPNINITVLTAQKHAGAHVSDIFPHLGHLNLPQIIHASKADWRKCDVTFSALPHGTAQDIIKTLPETMTVIDMSADFRLQNPKIYQKWYGKKHDCPERLKEAVYAIPELYRDTIKKTKTIACPGCYPTATLILLIPLIKHNLIHAESIIIDAKSGVSGAGRALKRNTLFCEIAEGITPYAPTGHRHIPEIEQQLTQAVTNPVQNPIAVTFIPHLVPVNRGELITAYVKTRNGNAQTIKQTLQTTYQNEPFIHILNDQHIPATQNVRGSNHCHINVVDAGAKNHVVLFAAIDNLVKGSAGQAIQNFNLIHHLNETTGLTAQPLFP